MFFLTRVTSIAIFTLVLCVAVSTSTRTVNAQAMNDKEKKISAAKEIAPTSHHNENPIVSTHGDAKNSSSVRRRNIFNRFKVRRVLVGVAAVMVPIVVVPILWSLIVGLYEYSLIDISW